MDYQIKKTCPHCRQQYILKFDTYPKQCRLPVFLSCGHTMCELCVTNLIKIDEPIDCQICHCDTQLAAEDLANIIENKANIHQFLPINFAKLGEITYQVLEQSSGSQEKKDNEFFLDLQAIIQSTEISQGQCMECRAKTSKICQECSAVLCDTCFNKLHKNYVIFKNHVLKKIEKVAVPNKCKVHKGKDLDYYCEDCHKSICVDCVMVGGEKSCKSHNVISMQEVNDKFFEDIIDITPKVDEIYRRLTKTAVDVGHLLHNIENETSSPSELTQLQATLEQHFSIITAAVQKHEKEVMDIVIKLKNSEKESLHKAKNDIANYIKKAQTFLTSINAITDANKAQQFNLSVLLEEAKQIVECPWYLSNDQSNDPLKVAVNEDLCSLVSDYVHLEGNANSVYKLRSTTDLGQEVKIPPPPPAPVFPPELPKDVHQFKGQSEKRSIRSQPTGFVMRVPSYRRKSGSVSSFNLLHSDSSEKSFGLGDQNYLRTEVHQVQPFAESPKQLHIGSQELVYISHIVDPHNFFVQRACHQNLVKEMLWEFRNANSLPKPSLNHVVEGRIYLMFNKADNMWQRCRVMSINREDPNKFRCSVFCIDFGNTETISIEKLRLMPPARVLSPFPLAINCSLANVEPKTGSWTTDDAHLIQDIIDNKQAIIYVRHIRSTANDSMKLECDVFTFEHAISLAHALVFHDRARMPNSKRLYPKILGVQERPKIFMGNSDIKPKSVEEVYITHIVSPDKFYVRKKHLMAVYEQLCEDLKQEYTVHNTGRVYLPEIGTSYAVCVESCREVVPESGWVRGVLMELPGRGCVRLLLPDTGVSLLLHWTVLRHLQKQFTTQRALATECHLAGVTPLNKQWSPASVALLQRFEDKLLELHVEDTRHGSTGVTLYDKSDPDNDVCLNTEMIKYKFAITFGLFRFNEKPTADDQLFTNKSPLDKPKPPSKPTGQVQDLQKKPKKINESELDAKDKGPLRFEAKVLHYQSPSLLYISLVHQQKAFNELYEEIQKHYSKKTQGKQNWAVGDRCCTLSKQSQTWRRALIVELDKDIAKVFFSDFAYVDTVPVSSLRELEPTFMAIGDAAIKCHLCGIVPPDGSAIWPNITKEYLKELLDAYQHVFITKLGNFKNKSMPVELWVYHTIQGGALEPYISEWRCLNKKIIEQGLCVPDKSQKQTSNEAEPTKDDTLSFLKNVTGSVDEWLQLEPLPQKPMSATDGAVGGELDAAVPGGGDEADDDDEPGEAAALNNTVFVSDWLPPEPLQLEPLPQKPMSTTDGAVGGEVDAAVLGGGDEADDDDDEPGEAAALNNTVFVSDWLPPEPLQATEFTAMPTHVDDDGIIYLHNVETQQDTLKLIRNALDVGFKAPDPKAKYASWSVGEPCIAMFSLDNRFYRARILDVNGDNKTCLVQYVDFGNYELCSFENMRKSILLYQIPVQAHKCVLARVRPAPPLTVWSPQTLDYIHKSIVEKNCFVKIVGEPVGDVTPIDLKCDKLWINDHLVDFEMAVYNDGSKAIVPKFAGDKRSKNKVKKPVVVPFKKVKEPVVVELDSSGSDYIVEDGKNLNQLIEEELDNFIEGRMITYPENNLTEFMCNVSAINDLHTLELSLIHDEDIKALYEEMFETVKSNGYNMSPLNGIFEHKACIALFPEDDQWYRASILEYSEAKGKIKVRYVDYGNVEIVSLADVREITDEWAELPAGTVSVRLYGVRVNPDVNRSVISKEFMDTFLDKGPFHGKVIKRDGSMPLVKLRDQNGELVYDNLIQQKIFLKCD